MSTRAPKHPLLQRTPSFISTLQWDDQKAIKSAFYNVFAFSLAGLSVLALVGVYWVLEPFIRPLLWALLVGSVLYPFKKRVVCTTKAWASNVRVGSLPFVVQLVVGPLIFLDNCSDVIGRWVGTYWKWIGGGFLGFLGARLLYFNPPMGVCWIIQGIVHVGIRMVRVVVGGEVVISVGVAYAGLLGYVMISKWRKQNKSVTDLSKVDRATKSLETTATAEASGSGDVEDKGSRPNPNLNQQMETEMLALSILSVVMWSVAFLYVCQNLPYFILIPFIPCMIAGGVGYFHQKGVEEIPQISMLATHLVLGIGRSGTSEFVPDNVHSSPWTSPFSSPILKGLREAIFTPKSSQNQEIGSAETDAHFQKSEVGLLDSNMYLYIVSLSCVVVQVWKHLWLLRLLPLPVLYYAIKQLCIKVGLVEHLLSLRDQIVQYNSRDSELLGSIFPTPIRVLFKIMAKADKKLFEFCEKFVDPVATAIILIAVILLSILFTLFAASQVYLEGDHFVRVTADLINTTVSQHPEINRFLPTGWESTLDTLVDNAYMQGKEWITNTIRDSIEDKDPMKAIEIEKQVIELWDKIYITWNRTMEVALNKSKREINNNDSGFEWNLLLLETGKTVPQMLDYSMILDYAKANFSTLLSLMESMWNIFVGNMSIALSGLSFVFSLIMGGGSAIINWIVNCVIFFTALFYLLNSSTTVYKPIEAIRSSIPGELSQRFLSAVEDAINGVFTASVKLGIFYGLYTFLVHSIFNINIIFVPSLLAALFGAIPIAAPYWAALPAISELILIEGNWTLGILMLVFQIAPISVVDTQIYSEIKGGHPYLTSLAVGGGILAGGMAGAIIGPVILCVLIIFIKMGSSYLNNEKTRPETQQLDVSPPTF